PDSASAAGSERLAPVTPLRRAAGSPERRSTHPAWRSLHAPRQGNPSPSGRSESNPRVGPGGTGDGVRPVAELPGAAGDRWNNTWADDQDAASVSSHRVGLASGGSLSEVGSDDEGGEETERLARKTSALTIRQLARRGMS